MNQGLFIDFQIFLRSYLDILSNLMSVYGGGCSAIVYAIFITFQIKQFQIQKSIQSYEIQLGIRKQSFNTVIIANQLYINLEVMQIEQDAEHQQYKIEKYHHRVSHSPLDMKKIQILKIKKGCIEIVYKESRNKPQDVIGFQNIGKIDYFQPKQPNKHAIAIKVKTEDKVNISFRVQTYELTMKLIEIINRKVNQLNDLPDYCDLLFRQEDIIDKIKEVEPEYKQVYKIFQSKISTPKLRTLLFQNHRIMIDYQCLALSKGFQIDKAFILIHNKDKPKQWSQPSILQGYDLAKSLQGIRIQDDQKKIKFVLSSEDIEEEIFFNYLPKVKEKNIWDEFEKIQEQKMQIQSKQQYIVYKGQGDSKINKVVLPKPVKGKYKISQSKQIFDKTYMKQQKRKDQRVQLNVDLAKRVTLTLKLFYKLSKYRDTTFQQINHIEKQLYRLQNSQPKPAPFLENSISKTLKNILKWKRQNQ